MLQYFIWDVDPEIFHIGTFPIRWYCLLFATSFLIGVQIISYIFKTEKKPLADIDPLLVTIVFSTILGARFGHFLFYEPEMFVQDPLRVITPPFDGLASHGAAVGIIIGLWFYSRRSSSIATGQTFLWTADRISIVVALSGAFIRFGNLMNSEIFGKPTDVPWAFIFMRSQEFSKVPRHPTQLYESLSCLLLFIILMWCWKVYREKFAPGTILGIFFVWVFSLRFVWEFFKENQMSFEDTMAFNMGQILSIPAILFGLILIFRKYARPRILIPIALVIQSSICYKCDNQPVSPESTKAQSFELTGNCLDILPTEQIVPPRRSLVEQEKS